MTSIGQQQSACKNIGMSADTGLVVGQGFYVRKRRMSAPVKKRQRLSFGDAAPIELPTLRELDAASGGCVLYLAWPALDVSLSEPQTRSIAQSYEQGQLAT